MNAIQQHIENMFYDIPETKEIKRIKNDLYLNAMDRQDELISLGKTESEALGTIIIEMGDRDVLLEDLGYNQEEDLKGFSLNSLDEARYLIEENKREGNKIGLGILMILFGAGLIPTFYTFDMVEIGVILLLILVAGAVGLFVTSGSKLEIIEKRMFDEDKTFYLTDHDYEIIEEEFFQFEENERFRIPIGVMLCILSVIPLMALAFLDRELLIERYGIVLVTTIVGMGVFQFVTYCMQHTAYEKVLSIGEYSVAEKTFQKKIEPIEAIYWISATVIYFLWSFTTMAWGITWIVWPIAGIVWALISVILKYRID